MFSKTGVSFQTPVLLIAPKRDAKFLRELCGVWLDQDGTIGKNNRGDASHSVIELFDDAHRFGMAVDVDIFVFYLMLAKELFDASAIGTPDGAVNSDFVGHESSTSQR
jgi:hypothetical protein